MAVAFSSRLQRLAAISVNTSTFLPLVHGIFRGGIDSFFTAHEGTRAGRTLVPGTLLRDKE